MKHIALLSILAFATAIVTMAVVLHRPQQILVQSDSPPKPGNGYGPAFGVVKGWDGCLYGVTTGGGKLGYGSYGYGTVYRLSVSSTLVTLTTLYSFKSDQMPTAGLTLGSDGRFYGTTGPYETGNYGSIFTITGAGEYRPIHVFAGGDAGGDPVGGLVQGRDGNFYGVTWGGGNLITGASTDNYRSTVFRITPTGKVSTLYYFPRGHDNNSSERPTGIVLGPDGSLYGTATSAEGQGHGIVFKLNSSNGRFTLNTVYSFKGSDGAYPKNMILGSDGCLYGITSAHYPYTGQGTGRETIFKLTRAGSLSYLRSFNYKDGVDLGGRLLEASPGEFYGTTGISGIQSLASIGDNGGGTVIKISSSGALTTLCKFTAQESDAAGSVLPTTVSGLVQGPDGNFYGTNSLGGKYGEGSVFQVTPSGELTTLYSFKDYGFCWGCG